MTDGGIPAQLPEEFHKKLDDEASWVSKPVPETITEAMERTPIVHQYDIVYAVLSRRLKKALTEGNPLSSVLQHSFANVALNFRAINPSFLGKVETARKSVDATSKTHGAMHSLVYGRNPMRPVQTTPSALMTAPPTVGEEIAGDMELSRGTLVAKLFQNLRHHIPLVLINIASKDPVPMNIGGAAHGRMFRLPNGDPAKELVYSANINVEILVATYDDTSTSNLQTIVEMVFSTLRDEIDDGPIAVGRQWRLTMPTRLTTSGVTEVEPMWGGGDKESKLYTATVSCEQMNFEGVGWIKYSPLEEDFDPIGDATPSIRLASEPPTTTHDEEMEIGLSGGARELIITSLPITASVTLDGPATRRVADLLHPSETGGRWKIIPRRTGVAELRVISTRGYVPVDGTAASGRAATILAKRTVRVTA